MTKFHELPDAIECGKMKEYFEEYLSHYSNNTKSENVNYALSELLELADRQWHTYQLLEECVKEKVERYLEEIIDFTQYIYTRFFCFFHFPTDVPGTSQNSNSTEKNSETEDKSYFFIRNIKLPIIVYPILAAIIANLDKKVVRTDYRKFKENILSTTLSIYPYYNEYAEKKLKREIPLSDKLLQKFYALFIDLLYPNELIDVLHQNYLDPSVVKLLLSRHILDTSFFCTRGGQSYFYRKLDEKIHQRIIGFFTIDDLFIIRKNIQDKEAQLFGYKKPRDIWRSYQNRQL